MTDWAIDWFYFMTDLITGLGEAAAYCWRDWRVSRAERNRRRKGA